MKSATSKTKIRKKKTPAQSNSDNHKAPGSPNSEDRFRLAFDNAPMGMAIVDFDYRITRANKSLCEALGYDEAELTKRRFTEITYPDDIVKDQALADQLFRGEIPSYRLEKRFVTKNGGIAWLDLTALVIREKNGKPLYGLAMVENITEQRRIQEALRTSEERYRSFVVNSSEGIWRIEIEQPIDTELPPDEQLELFMRHAYLAECNDAMARMYGHDRADDIIGSSFAQFMSDQHQNSHTRVIQFIHCGYRLQNLRSEGVTPEGRKKYFALSLIGIVMNGMLLRVWGVQRDRTEQQNAEIQLAQSHQQLRTLTAHVNSLRERERADLARELHDVLGQPLTSMKIEIALLRKRIKQGDETPTAVVEDKLKEIISMLDSTLESVKALSTELRPGVLDKFGLAAAIEWQCEEFCRRSGINCECHVPENDLNLNPEISTAVFRILQEALTNVVRHARAQNVHIDLKMIEENIVLTVKDDGKGITEKQRLSPTSLGLLGMSERATSLGGTLTVSSEPKKGTLVTVSIPLASKSPEAEHD